MNCTQECHLFVSTKHPLTHFVKPYQVLNLAMHNVFYIQSAFMYNPGSTGLIVIIECTSTSPLLEGGLGRF